MLKYFILLSVLVQTLVAAPTTNAPLLNDELQKELVAEARNETINLLNSLFRAQISYFSQVGAKLNPQMKRAQDIQLYVTRLNEAIAVNELEKKDEMWLSIFEEFSKSPLLVNREAETGLSNVEYQALLTDDKLQQITKSFLTDVSSYFWKMAKVSGKVVGKAFDDYIEREKQHANALTKN
ncbi:uncharacterized protein LOC6642808 [Drosophila willistoni]|uniref:uncharacterized protein LOC6642808 n=1 Tax=Drosophila willistoni TaxID=7260 RepID=UPI00017D7527|nr:uncharacterized protein LOC6642808 [Drosophila willistoni]